MIQSFIQSLKCEYEILMMNKNDSVMDFATKFTTIVSDLQRLGKTLIEQDVVCRFLHATPAKFDALTLSLE